MRKKGDMYLVGNGYSEILESVNADFIYVGISYEVIILIKRKRENCNYEGMAYSLLTYNIATFEVNINELKEMHKDLLFNIIDEQYKLYDDQEELKDNMTTALKAIKKINGL